MLVGEAGGDPHDRDRVESGGVGQELTEVYVWREVGRLPLPSRTQLHPLSLPRAVSRDWS